MNSFILSGIPKTYFGAGSISKLSSILAGYGSNIALLTGSKSLERNGNADMVRKSLEKEGFKFHEEKVPFEPSADLIDSIVSHYRGKNINAVCAIGGGSVVDAGKAVAAMLEETEGIKTFLETVGTKKPSGKTLPLIAVPTTSGTGSEATKNAVITQLGDKGFKSSLRHDNFIPSAAIIDPELTTGCPPFVTACCGLDALSQLIESYFSTQSNAFTNALAIDAIEKILTSLPAIFSESPDNIELRSRLSYSAFISGFTLAHAGLCVVHGLASTIGYKTTAPHGLICGLLLKEWLNMTINHLENPDLNLKFKSLASLVSKTNNPISVFISFLDKFYSSLNLPKLSEYGLTQDMIPEIASLSGSKNNPFPVSQEDKELLLRKVL